MMAKNEAYAGKFTHINNATKEGIFECTHTGKLQCACYVQKNVYISSSLGFETQPERVRGSWPSWLKTSILLRHPAQTV